MIIADEEIGEKARLICNYLRDTDEPPLKQAERITNDLRDLLSAARAEGMEEAAAIVSDLEDANFSKKPVDWVAGVLAAEIAIRCRISSLKPKTTDEA